MKRVALLAGLLVAASFTLVGCGGSKASGPPSGLTERVFASQSVASPTASPGLFIIDAQYDTLARAREIGAGTSPGLMAITSDRSTLLVFDSATNTVAVINTERETLTGGIPLAGPTTSMVAVSPSAAYAAVPATPLNGAPAPGAVVVMNLVSGVITANIGVPNVQTVVPSPAGTQLLAFSSDSDAVTVVSPLLVNTGNPVTATVSACPGCRPVNAIFSADGSTAYILNCGAECGGMQGGVGTLASVQTLDMATLTLGTSVAVDGATIAFLSGSTLYVAGNSVTNNSCAGQTTAATICGRLDIVDLGSSTGTMTVTGSAVITDGYHDRIDMSVNGQLFLGSYGCTNIGNVNNPQGEVRGCLSIYNTANASIVIPPDNGDVTGLQGFVSRDVEYVAEGGNLRVYDTLIDSLLPPNNFIGTGTIIVTGQIIDVKAVDFF